MTHPKDDPSDRWLAAALGLDAPNEPFPWQSRLLRRFLCGKVDRALDLPTGLGKTAVMAIWTVARALGAPVPRRLVYVVDRRAVVDQATEAALRIRKWVDETPVAAEGLGLRTDDGTLARSLPISTLRGQFVDNREWLDDPGLPAIIVGTVDMVGSRLLFQGYGSSRKMRPYQAALLGCDAMYVIDEAHLVPPFERLLEDVMTRRNVLGPRDQADASLIPPIHVLSLSATGRDHGEGAFRLAEEDHGNEVVEKRMTAKKRLVIAAAVTEKDLAATLAARAWEVCEGSEHPARCIVFSNRRTDAEKAEKELLKLARAARGKKETLPSTELFVGGRRVWERGDAARRLVELGFLAGSDTHLDDHAFVFATSAGEVGVDLDADHMVADVVAWERMVQRLGRVNRRGDGDALVQIIPTDADAHDFEPGAVLELLNALPKAPDGTRDASLAALSAVRSGTGAALEQRATTPEPLRPGLTRPLIEAWAMTALREHTGRPEVAPWLRGWIDDLPQTTLVWRKHLSDVVRVGTRSTHVQFFEAAPPHLSERLETDSPTVANWLLAVTKRRRSAQERESHEDVVALLMDRSNEIVRTLKLDDELLSNPREKKQLVRAVAGKVVAVDAELGGLSDNGLLDPSVQAEPSTADDERPWGQEPEEIPTVPWRVRKRPGDASPIKDTAWRERLRLPLEHSNDGDVTWWLVVERWRQDARTEEDRSTSPRLQTLREHEEWAMQRARRLAEGVGLPKPYIDAVSIAARLHDEGKRAQSWQRAFHAPVGDVYAKTPGPVDVHRLGGYRHEFGSLPYAEQDVQVKALSDDLRDLVLHLIAAHHGFARPLIPTEGCDDAPPSQLEDRARAVALRFVRLQDRFGPWGLAYLEALLRAADQQASRANDEREGS